MKNPLSKIVRKIKGSSHSVDLSQKDNGPSDFETAISATGFGKFNICLMLVAIPSGWSSMFETSTISFVSPVAQCDLNLSLEEKGYLNSVTYLGMISSAILWGFLSDTLGRKKLMVVGYLLDAFFAAMSGFSQSFLMLAISKFMGGVIINGPFAVLTTILSEFHCAKYRARVILSMGVVFSTAALILPLLAWALLPNPFTWELFDGAIVLHSWNVFLLIAGLPSLVSGICHMFLPESPKFLMTAGRNDEALEVFKKIYSLNTGKPRNTFPIKELVDETLNKNEKDIPKINKWESLKGGLIQMMPLFRQPLLLRFILVSVLHLLGMMGLNTLRLWLPQLFTAMNDYKSTYNEDGSMCSMLEMISPQTSIMNGTTVCSVNYDNGQVYLSSAIVSISAMSGYLVIGTLINLLGKKFCYVCLGTVAGLSGLSLYFAENSTAVVALASTYIALSGINTNVLMTIVVDLFPTTLRTMTVSLSMMFGRSGASLGNAVFPLLLNMGCWPPFLFIGLSTLTCTLIAVVLPKTDMKALE